MSELRKQHKVRRLFTLVEIMVALAMLMLMMSFLFEFVLSSQKLWRASENQARVFDDAQVALTIIGDDLRNMEYNDEVGRSLPYYRFKAKDGLTMKVKVPGEEKTVSVDVYVFFSQFHSKNDTEDMGVYPIVYVYVPSSENHGEPVASRRLYRLQLDNIAWNLFNVDFAEKSGTALASSAAFQLLFKDVVLSEDDLLLDNVSYFRLLAEHGTGTAGLEDGAQFTSAGFAKEQPRSIRIELNVFSRDGVNQDEWAGAVTADGTASSDATDALLKQHERNFAKTIRLQ